MFTYTPAHRGWAPARAAGEVERAHVGGNILLHNDVDNPGHNVCPDVLVAFGVERKLREI